jgi:cytochrome c1
VHQLSFHSRSFRCRQRRARFNTFGRPNNFGAGVLSNTETNLFRWLKNPQDFKPGCFMPNLKLTDAQAGALTSYLETLK